MNGKLAASHGDSVPVAHFVPFSGTQSHSVEVGAVSGFSIADVQCRAMLISYQLEDGVYSGDGKVFDGEVGCFVAPNDEILLGGYIRQFYGYLRFLTIG